MPTTGSEMISIAKEIHGFYDEIDDLTKFNTNQVVS